MTKFVCRNCNYRFDSQYDQQDKNCPYCGKKMLEIEKCADDLLKDLDLS